MTNTKIIGLVGEKGNGKDTVATLIGDMLQWNSVVRTSFAWAVKEEVAEQFDLNANQIDFIKNRPCVRHVLQWWGTDVRRAENPNYWIDKTKKSIEHFQRGKFQWIILTDVRFENEANLIHSMGGTLVKVIRPDVKKDSLSTHSSETNISKINPDIVIHNTGTVIDLERPVAKLIELLELGSSWLPVTIDASDNIELTQRFFERRTYLSGIVRTLQKPEVKIPTTGIPIPASLVNSPDVASILQDFDFSELYYEVVPVTPVEPPSNPLSV